MKGGGAIGKGRGRPGVDIKNECQKPGRVREETSLEIMGPAVGGREENGSTRFLCSLPWKAGTESSSVLGRKQPGRESSFPKDQCRNLHPWLPLFATGKVQPVEDQETRPMFRQHIVPSASRTQCWYRFPAGFRNGAWCRQNGLTCAYPKMDQPC